MAAVAEGRSAKVNWLKQAWADTDRYWFAYGSATTVGVFRILLGFINLANLLLILPFFDAWYSERGFTPQVVTDTAAAPLARDFLFFNSNWTFPVAVPRINVFSYITSTPIFLTLYWVMIIAAFLTMIGLWTRLSSFILAIGIVSLQHRNLLILHGGDSVVRLGALYMAIAPSGKACSLDRLIGLWKGKVQPGPALVSVWPQRVIAFNLALIYFTTWWVKMDGSKWRNGTATWFPARINEFHRFWVPPILMKEWMAPVLTYSTLITELCLGTLVFWKPARKWVLLGGMMMHGYIEYAMNIPLFAFGICSWYIVFYEGEEISGWAQNLGRRLKRFQLLVRVPQIMPLTSNAANVLRAADPFGLVTYEHADQETVTAEGADGPEGEPERAIYRRAIGTLPFAIVPGLRHRLLQEALPSVTKS